MAWPELGTLSVSEAGGFQASTLEGRPLRGATIKRGTIERGVTIVTIKRGHHRHHQEGSPSSPSPSRGASPSSHGHRQSQGMSGSSRARRQPREPLAVTKRGVTNHHLSWAPSPQLVKGGQTRSGCEKTRGISKWKS
ncbi:hypothetical protein THAOC_09838 [Thalassiosira oceanica]|uniref:Uncharacterized protein n=1 Tax=Thalassiosira oceanica TaxID=159749 RepID=K0SVF7_THAOC|nr:hypothetical protein THAOC_09838 [Thalassiosira oceanica]|eukprot:EJK68949.1 hypothetical protein THAOC_09838 [Thalassiosira oceanica]